MLVERKACFHVDVANAFLVLGAYLLHSQPEKVQNVRFWQRALGVNGLISLKSLQHDISDTPSAYHSIHLLSVMVSIN